MLCSATQGGARPSSGTEVSSTVELRKVLLKSCSTAVMVSPDSDVDLRRVCVLDCSVGVSAKGAGAAVQADGCEVAGVAEAGVVAEGGAAVTARGCTIKGVERGAVGVWAVGAKVKIALDGCRIEGDGSGVVAVDGASVEMMQCEVEGSEGPQVRGCRGTVAI